MKDITLIGVSFFLLTGINAAKLSDLVPKDSPEAIFKGNTGVSGNQSTLFFYSKNKWLIVQISEMSADFIEGIYVRTKTQLTLIPKKGRSYCRVGNNDFEPNCGSACNPDCRQSAENSDLLDLHSYKCQTSKAYLESQTSMNCLNLHLLKAKFNAPIDGNGCIKDDFFCKNDKSDLCERLGKCRIRSRSNNLEIKVLFELRDLKSAF